MDESALNATLVYRRDLNQRLSIVRVSPDGRSVPDFEPGQFVLLALPVAAGPDESTHGEAAAPPRLVRRAYSVASPPSVRDYLEFYVVLIREGALTPSLWSIRKGGRLWLDHRASGRFTLRDVPTGKDLVMVATGTGLGPFMSMLRHYRGRSRWRRFLLLHSARTAEDLGYREELEDICRQDPSVLYLPTLTREPPDSAWTGLRGRVQTILEGGAFERLAGSPLVPESTHVFLCGHPEMIESVSGMLQSRGFRPHSKRNPGQLHFEKYW